MSLNSTLQTVVPPVRMGESVVVDLPLESVSVPLALLDHTASIQVRATRNMLV